MSESITAEALKNRERRLSGSIILGVPIVLVLITFLFWYQTWFGRRLTNAEIIHDLQDTSIPHKTQHALTQVATEIMRHDPGVEEVYPQVVALAGNKEPGLRSMAAWVMGQDDKSETFHHALAKLVDDPEPMVRWNAALALTRFRDAEGRAQLRAMLHPYNIQATVAGTITFKVNPSDSVKAGSVVARIETKNSEPSEIRSPLAGLVEKRLVSDGVNVSTAQEIATISPDDQQVWEALRGLYLVGQADDLADVEAFLRPPAGTSDRVREQAAETAEAIRGRMANLAPGRTGAGPQEQASEGGSVAKKDRRPEK